MVVVFLPCSTTVRRATRADGPVAGEPARDLGPKSRAAQHFYRRWCPGSPRDTNHLDRLGDVLEVPVEQACDREQAVTTDPYFAMPTRRFRRRRKPRSWSGSASVRPCRPRISSGRAGRRLRRNATSATARRSPARPGSQVDVADRLQCVYVDQLVHPGNRRGARLHHMSRPALVLAWILGLGAGRRDSAPMCWGGARLRIR